MFDLHCPKCGSSRIHRGYNETPLYKRIFGFQNLLCNGCNLLFTGFAWPGTVQKHSRRKRKQEKKNNPDPAPVTPSPVRHRTALDLAQEMREHAPQPAVATEPRPVAQPAETPVVLKTASLTAVAGGVPEASAPPALPDIAPASPPAPSNVTKPVIKTARVVIPEPSDTTQDSHRSRRHKKSEAEKRQPGILDYARFGLYYSGLYLKAKMGMRQTTHSLEPGFRWRNWWHWQRTQKDAKHG